ncbi:MAG TPA: hypothetical protein DCE48_12440 [Lachnospiraceae bacterium]|uniref:hypothetical protein n=1 Tax=Anaerosporobacter sp. TaxID=1872529 RepID=UPI000EDB5FF1|nr:hypothetical protein [Anaerosporobacter sp.]HAB61477.1 hypothetical protein [Lachnospiraceae bacterium]
MKKLGKKIISHAFLCIGVLCFSIVSYNAARYYIMQYNAFPVLCEITKVVNDKKDDLAKNQDSNGRVYSYGTYVNYNLEGEQYKNVRVAEQCGEVGDTIEVHANKYEPTRLLYISSTKKLVFKLLMIEGILCIVIEIYMNYRRKKKVRQDNTG